MNIIGTDIRFPNLGIDLENVGITFEIFGISIAYYGVIIALAMVVGYLVADWQAKRTGQDKELYLDFALYAIISAIIGARIYYVIFAWDEFSDNLLQIFNLRGGGLGFYGGASAAVIAAFVYSKMKKVSFWLMVDTSCIGLIAGQIIGRWGNFFNREAFGGYTNNLFAMQLKKSDVASSNITSQLYANIVNLDGIEYVQVHPTFLYESLWNVMILVIMILFTRHKKFDGEIFMIYLLGYGIGRLWIEGLRTDQLLFWGTNLPVSQLVSLIMIIFAIVTIALKRTVLRKKN
jgi:phosphatidylglycerol---prolipoprotein diacylglyceryl transferase